MSRSTTLAFALAAVLALGACTAQEPEISMEDQVPAEQRDASTEAEGEAGGEGEGEGEGGQGADASVYEAFDLGYEGPTELTAGDVAITLENTGNLPHDITIEELGDETVVEADGGGSDSATVTLDPGSYTFYCSVPGHRAAMELEVEVAE